MTTVKERTQVPGPDRALQLPGATAPGDRVLLSWADVDTSGFGDLGDWVRIGRQKVFGKLREEVSPVLDDETLSDVGKRERISELARADHLGGWLELVANRVEKELRQVREERSKLSAVDPADPTDARAAIREMELRNTLRSMKPDERSRVLAQAADEGNEEVLQAILAAPPLSLKVPEETLGALKEQVLRRKYGDRLDELDHREEVYRRAAEEFGTLRTLLGDAETLYEFVQKGA